MSYYGYLLEEYAKVEEFLEKERELLESYDDYKLDDKYHTFKGHKPHPDKKREEKINEIIEQKRINCRERAKHRADTRNENDKMNKPIKKDPSFRYVASKWIVYELMRKLLH